MSQLQYRGLQQSLIIGVLQALPMGCAFSCFWGSAAVVLHLTEFASKAGWLMHQCQFKGDRMELARLIGACQRWLLSASGIQRAGSEQKIVDCAAALGIEGLAARLQSLIAFFGAHQPSLLV